MTNAEAFSLAISLCGLVVAFLSLIVSAILGYLKAQEYSPNLKIYLEWQAFYEKCHLVIINLSKRPVVIQKITVRATHDGLSRFDVLEGDQEESLPIKLSQGDPVRFVLTDSVANLAYHRGQNWELDVLVYDSEGNEHIPTLKREWNPRGKGYSKFEKLARSKGWVDPQGDKPGI